MTTCYEKLRKKMDSKGDYKRLESYFRALDTGDLDQYHDEREKRKEMRRDNKNEKT